MTKEDYGLVTVYGKPLKFNDKAVELKYRVGWLSGMLLPEIYNSLEPKKTKIRDLMGELIEHIRLLNGDWDGNVDTKEVESLVISDMIDIIGLVDDFKSDLDRLHESSNVIHLELEAEKKVCDCR
jgi:hypothetical protein